MNKAPYGLRLRPETGPPLRVNSRTIFRIGFRDRKDDDGSNDLLLRIAAGAAYAKRGSWLRKMMKKIEKLALVLIVGLIFQLVARPVFVIWLARHMTTEHWNSFEMITPFITSSWTAIISIGCGVWLLLDAEKEKMSKSIWFLFGLLFHLQAIAIFYLYVILQEMREQKTANLDFAAKQHD